MRDEKEERKKQARSNKQTRQSNTAHMYHVISPQLTVQCHSQKKAPCEMFRGSAVTDQKTTYYVPHNSHITPAHSIARQLIIRIIKNKTSVALNPLVSPTGRLVARSGRKRGNRQTDRQNDKTTTVTLAAHARRRLLIMIIGIYTNVKLNAIIIINIFHTKSA